MSTEWYYASGGQQAGPVSPADIQQLAAAGTLRPDDLVWNRSMTEWVAAKHVRGLQFGSEPPVTVATAASEAPVREGAPEEGATDTVEPADTVVPAYRPTAAQMLGYESPGGEGVPVTRRSIELLRETRPWVLTMGVLMFIVVGLMVFGAIMMFIVAVVGGAGAAGVGIGIGFVYLLMAALFAAPPVFLVKYASGIRKLTRFKRACDIEEALAAQKSYWKYVTIMTLVVAALYLVFFSVMFIMRF